MSYNQRPRHGGNTRSYSTRRQPSRGPRQQYIDPSRFIREAINGQTETYVPKNSFADFEISSQIKSNLTQKGFTTPTPIQDQAIPYAFMGKDIIGIAATGTGKTVAFAIPILQKITTDRQSRSLIVAPTRELAGQIRDDIRNISGGTGAFDALLIGGSPMGRQLSDLQRNPNIVIGTPGRIKDHIGRGSLRLERFNMVTLDEVDRMLDMGFIHDVRHILQQLPQSRHSMFFSATLDLRVTQLIQEFSNQPITVSIKSRDTSENVHQDVVRYSAPEQKFDLLHDTLISEGVKKTLVFESTQRGVERLQRKLVDRGFKADSIHGGKTQGQRRRALDNFKRDLVDILVATDVAARGIDVDGISHVINFSTPNDYEDYIHRIGRTGRAGSIGYALTFVAK